MGGRRVSFLLAFFPRRCSHSTSSRPPREAGKKTRRKEKKRKKRKKRNKKSPHLVHREEQRRLPLPSSPSLFPLAAARPLDDVQVRGRQSRHAVDNDQESVGLQRGRGGGGLHGLGQVVGPRGRRDGRGRRGLADRRRRALSFFEGPRGRTGRRGGLLGGPRGHETARIYHGELAPAPPRSRKERVARDAGEIGDDRGAAVPDDAVEQR